MAATSRLLSRNFLLAGALLYAVGCGLTWAKHPVPEAVLTERWDQMYEAAISAGASMGYQVEYQDRKNGMLKLLNKVGTTEYRIEVRMGRLDGGETGYFVKGNAGGQVINPVIKSQVQNVEAAINEVVSK